ncbi:DoxX family membrane protein [Flagellimonas okinawensis]|uniref:DoxX family membrane protein n=1 Tax=Flagellimonas okinawensis TaxID=3031324 RepID=A0ABT5XU31_9FLAO|nr:DoxX family membrane protein [[Muricauda] okinawensis]MDF0709061.1 DoxX family membrane protein [[Muricauda] okinawensis]
MEKIEKLKNYRLLTLLYWCARIGMGLAFIASGARKLPGIKFTNLPIENPVGFYFEAMYSTGFYWNFIGYFQILLGVLIFFNRFVVLSSLLMMPIVINIFLISVSLNMRGTPMITSAMVLGNLLLLLWHFKNYRTIFLKPVQ